MCTGWSICLQQFPLLPPLQAIVQVKSQFSKCTAYKRPKLPVVDPANARKSWLCLFVFQNKFRIQNIVVRLKIAPSAFGPGSDAGERVLCRCASPVPPVRSRTPHRPKLNKLLRVFLF